MTGRLCYNNLKKTEIQVGRLPMKILLLIILGVTPLVSLDYRISAKLDTEKKTVTGQEQIVWKNERDAPATFLVFHLYMNAFAGSETVFMRESGGRHRGFGFDRNDLSQFGYCQVMGVRVNDRDRISAFHGLSTLKNREKYGVFWKNEISYGIGADDTLAVLELDEPVPPGGEVRLAIDFETKFPRIFARSGYSKSFFMGGQWFPKLAVFEGANGWNGHFYHLHSEFFADFADFSVVIDAPSEFVVGATGVCQAEVRQGRRTRWTFVAERVHDFVFTAWDRFRVAEDRWKNVRLRLLYQPGNRSTVARQFRALKAGLDICEYLTGVAYPYPHFTLVDVPFHGAGAGGMEYPMLVTGIPFSPFYPESFFIADSVIIHEFIHNYFYGILASNEFEHPWMDEGLTSFATSLALEKYYGRYITPLVYASAFDLDAIGMHQYRGREFPMKAAWEFAEGYGTMSYNKPSVFLKTLDNLVGRETLRRVFRTYFERFCYRHPRPEDFFTILRETAGGQAADLFERGMETDTRVDFAIHSVHSENLAERTSINYDPRSFKFEKVEPPVRGKAVHRNTIVVGNRGDFSLPVTVRAVFKDGSTLDFHWDGGSGWKRFQFMSEVPLVGALVDPGQVYICDQDLTNNAKTIKKQTGWVFRKGAAALAAMGVLMFSVYSLLF